jgi:CRP-like cAMP-binding protein
MTQVARYGYALSTTDGIVMVWSIPVVSRPERPTNVLNKPTGNRLLAALPEQAIAHLAPDLRQVTLPQGVVCYGAGDPIDQVYFPQTGMISLLVTTGGDGAMVETSSVGREGAVGVQCGNGPCLSFTRAIVQIGGNFLIISAPRFEAATSRSAELRELMFAYIETLWAEAQQIAACNAIHDGSSRLCRWLLQCANRTGSDRVPLTQEFLAEMPGVRRTTVTLLAQELQRRGILRYSRGRITILDRAALEACACDCYEVIRKLSTVAILPTRSDRSQIA